MASRRVLMPKEPELSPERRVLLRAIHQHIADHGAPPSTLDLVRATGLSRGAIRGTMARMERDGLVGDVPKVVRSGRWFVTEKGEAARK